MKLSQEQLTTFDREGFLFLPECFDDEECSLLGDEAEAIFATERTEVWREKSGAPRTAFAAHTYNEAFRRLGAHPRLIGPVEQLFGEPLYIHQFKTNAKALFDGELWQWHQDYGVWSREDGMPEHRRLPRRGNADQWSADVHSKEMGTGSPTRLCRTLRMFSGHEASNPTQLFQRVLVRPVRIQRRPAC